MWMNADNINDFVGLCGAIRYTHSLAFSAPTIRGGITGLADGDTSDWAEGTYKSDIYSMFAHVVSRMRVHICVCPPPSTHKWGTILVG